jgi:hypothetical protein
LKDQVTAICFSKPRSSSVVAPLVFGGAADTPAPVRRAIEAGQKNDACFCALAFREIWCLQLCCASAATLAMERGCPPQDNLPKNSKSVILMKY